MYTYMHITEHQARYMVVELMLNVSLTMIKKSDIKKTVNCSEIK